MRNRSAAIVGLAIAIALLSTGCVDSTKVAEPDPTPSSSSAAPTPTPTPSATAEPIADPRGASYGSLEEMRVAVEAAGVPCPTLVDLYQNPDGSNSGFCEDRMWLLATFTDIEARNAVLQLNVESLEPGTYLTGPNWLLGSADIENDASTTLGPLQPALGGVVWEYTQPFPA